VAESHQSEIARLELLYAAHPEGRVFAHLAEAYRRAGELERAWALLEAGLERHADYASAHVVHGRVLLDLGREAEAEAAFRRVLGLDPENLVALRALGDLARRAGRAAEALGYYEQLRRRDPTNPEIEAVVAALAAEVGQAAASPRTETLEEPTAMDETALLGGEMVTETLADLYLSQGLAERAATLYRQLLIMRPGDPRLQERLEQALAAAAPRNGQHAPPPQAAAQEEAPADATDASAGGPEPVVAPEPDGIEGAEPTAVGFDLERLTEVEAAWTGAEAAGTESVSPYTWQEEAGPATPDRPLEPTIRAYFERLTSWKPSRAAIAAAAPAAAPPASPVDEFDALFTPASSVELSPGETPPAEEADASAAAEAPEPAAASGALVGLADLLVGLLEYHDSTTPGGSGLVRQVATAIGRELGMDEPALRSLALAAVLQGIGRLALRRRPGGDATASAEPETHALAVTLELLGGLDLPAGVQETIAHVHHRWDGAGGVEPAGESIPLSARILAVARDFAALLAPSAVEPPQRVQAALDALGREAGRRYDPTVVNSLVRLVGSQARSGFGLRHHVVIVHRHSPTAAVLAARLRSSGYVPEAVDDVARAWERLSAAPADALLITDDVGAADLPRFLMRLREDRKLAGIPVIIAGADALERRIELLNAGADVCFPGDVRFNELHATLAALLRRAARAGLTADGPGAAAEHARRYALHGDLVDFPLTWVLDVLAFDGRSAVVSVAAPDDEGTVYVERGSPRHAETRSCYGEAALREMLRWRHGSFSVHLDAPPVPQTIHRAVVDLLVASDRTQGQVSGSSSIR